MSTCARRGSAYGRRVCCLLVLLAGPALLGGCAAMSPKVSDGGQQQTAVVAAQAQRIIGVNKEIQQNTYKRIEGVASMVENARWEWWELALFGGLLRIDDILRAFGQAGRGGIAGTIAIIDAIRKRRNGGR